MPDEPGLTAELDGAEAIVMHRYRPNWLSTELRASQGEDWLVPCDRGGGGTYDDWWDALPDSWAELPFRRQVEEAWQASRKRHTAKLRRIGWLDQLGRVWQEIPPEARAEEMHCGSFTPLLIDVRDDDAEDEAR
jgi:hypothetical protein